MKLALFFREQVGVIALHPMRLQPGRPIVPGRHLRFLLWFFLNRA
jgi:hypothetical protein